MECIPNHFGANEAQNSKGDNACILRYFITDKTTEDITNARHEALKKSEGYGHENVSSSRITLINKGI